MFEILIRKLKLSKLLPVIRGRRIASGSCIRKKTFPLHYMWITAMKVLTSKKWTDVPLDYAAAQDEIYVRVHKMLNIARVEGAYFQRGRDWRMVVNYLREIGLKHTLIKIISRTAERARNEKFISIGCGYVLEKGKARAVYFVAPFHPACIDQLPLHPQLLYFSGEDLLDNQDTVEHAVLPERLEAIAQKFDSLSGWSAFSGAELPSVDWDTAQSLLQSANIRWNKLPTPSRKICTVSNAEKKLPTSTINATLFGFGNYAKTVILPNLPPQLKVTRIHEVDPLQLSPKAYCRHICSSDAGLSPDDKNKVFFIAGFHHTHADIAFAALARNAQVVVEKPLITTWTQLEQLQAILGNTAGQYFACFHKRYQRFNAFVREDFKLSKNSPVNYYAIVFEVPLPKLHWYRWPNSQSRIISNGCHWLDHFLFLNNYNAVSRYDAFIGGDGTVSVSVSLENGALFNMVLTDTGSARLGVQDHIELRQGATTIKIANGSYYRAENSNKILRISHCNRMESYQLMYRSIGAAIANGVAGDTVKSIVDSSSLTLSIDDLVNKKAGVVL